MYARSVWTRTRWDVFFEEQYKIAHTTGWMMSMLLYENKSENCTKDSVFCILYKDKGNANAQNYDCAVDGFVQNLEFDLL